MTGRLDGKSDMVTRESRSSNTVCQWTKLRPSALPDPGSACTITSGRKLSLSHVIECVHRQRYAGEKTTRMFHLAHRHAFCSTITTPRCLSAWDCKATLSRCVHKRMTTIGLLFVGLRAQSYAFIWLLSTRVVVEV